MLVRICGDPTKPLPRGLKLGDERDIQRSGLTALGHQVGRPIYEFTMPTGRGQHFSERSDYDSGDEFFGGNYTLPDPPEIKDVTDPNQPDVSMASAALRKADEALRGALTDLIVAKADQQKAQFAALLLEDNDTAVALGGAQKLTRIRQDRFNRRQIEHLETEQRFKAASATDLVPSTELRRCTAELRQLAAICNERDLWHLLDLPPRDEGMSVYYSGTGGAMVISRLREVLTTYLTQTGRESIPVARAVDQPDIALLITLQPVEEEQES